MTKTIINIKIGRTNLPIIKMAGQKSGPTVFVVSGIHGDETDGPKVIKTLTNKLSQTPLKRGMIYLIAQANPWGFKSKTRLLAGRDLNRSFPGKPNGHLAEKIAYQIFNFIKKTKPTLIIDLHNDWPNSLPYLLIDPPNLAKNKKAYDSALRLAQKTGWLIVQEKSNQKEVKLLKKTLTGCCLKNNFLALVLESGDTSKFSAKGAMPAGRQGSAPGGKKQNIQDNLTAIWRILADLKMVRSAKANLHYQPPKKLQGKILKYCDEPKSSKSGRIKFFIRAGKMIKKNQLLTKISNAELIAKNTGIVLGTTDNKTVKKDETIIASGLINLDF